MSNKIRPELEKINKMLDEGEMAIYNLDILRSFIHENFHFITDDANVVKAAINLLGKYKDLMTKLDKNN